MEELPPAVRQLLAAQDGVVTRSQLLLGGVSRAAVSWNAGRHWRVVLPCVFILGRDTPRERQKQIAALLWSGDRSVLAGSTAAAFYGVEAAALGGPIRILVPAPQRSRAHGFVSVRRTRLHDAYIVQRGPLRLSSRARACIDACLETRSATTRSAIVIEAVQKQIATNHDLGEWADRLRPRDAAQVRLALNLAAEGVWSVPEAEVLAVLHDLPGHPDIWCNPTLREPQGQRLLTPDLWFDDVALAVMVHSHRFHAAGDDWDETVEGDDNLRAAGVEVVAVTPRRVRQHPQEVRARILAALERASGRPRPAVVATRRQSAA